MEISLIGSLITFQVTFTELFIAATVVASVTYKYGWKSAALGSVLGAIAIVVISFTLGSAASRMPIHILDWVSGILLFGFGVFLYYEFWSAHKKGEGAAVIDRGAPVADGAPAGLALAPERVLAKPVNWAGVSIAAWGMFAEGLEIMIVWLAITLKHGMATATLGVLIGIGVIGLVALVLAKFGVFEKIPPKYLDFVAGTMVTLYGIYFLYEAIIGTFAAS